MRLKRTALVCLALIISQSGCLSTGGAGGGRLSRLLPAPEQTDYGPSGSSDPWIQEAVAEGRRDHSVEKVNDPLKLRRFFVSERAREIEASVGIVD